MRIDLAKVTATGVYELPDGHDGINRVEVTELTRAAGVIEITAGCTVLDRLRAPGGRIDGLHWRAGDVLVTTSVPIEITDLTLTARFGHAGDEDPSLPHTRLELGAGRIVAQRLAVQLEGIEARAEVSAAGLTLLLEGEKVSVVVREVTLRDVEIDLGAVKVRIPEVQASTLAFADNELLTERLAASEVIVTLDDVAELTRPTEPEVPLPDLPAPLEPHALKPRGTPGFDVHFLDHLNGQVDVDLTVDISVPVIGRRRATHHFRVPIQSGAINYKQLERDLSALEDSVLDLHLRDDRLALEKGIPLIPILFHKPIIYWPLTPEEVGLAKRMLVRLRTLMNWRIPEDRREDDKQPPAVVLRRLELHNTDVELTLGGPTAIDLGPTGRILLGSESEPAIGNLWLRGELVHFPGQTPAPTEVRLGATNLNVALHHLSIGGFRGDGTMRVEGLHDVVVHLDGSRATSAGATARGLILTALRLRFPQAPPDRRPATAGGAPD